MVMCKFIGIDISKQTFDSAFEKENKKWKQTSYEYTSDGMCSFYENLPEGERAILMEATGTYYLKLAYFLYEKGEKVALLEMRGHAAWYVKGMKGATFVRRELSNVSTRKDLVNIIEKYREYQKEGPI